MKSTIADAKLQAHASGAALDVSGEAAAGNGVENSAIVVTGARVHNLKNISFEIPHNAITVVTGVSGSGKSSLAFDTIYAEGQRRYVESLSAYARQFLERIEKPDVDEISGIAPAIAIRQKNSTRNPRSTVATATEIYDYLRLLYARAGRTFCTRCGDEVRRDTLDEIAARVITLEAGPTILRVVSAWRFPSRRRKPLAARPTRPAGEAVKHALISLQKRGFNRLVPERPGARFSSPETLLEIDFAQPVFVLVDRLAISPDIRSRLADSIEICYREGNGEAILEFPPLASATRRTAPTTASGQRQAQSQRLVSVSLSARLATSRRMSLPLCRLELIFSERFECKTCGLVYQEPEPRLFSFNNPYGACARCQGFGNTIDFGIDLVIPDHGKSINGGVDRALDQAALPYSLAGPQAFCAFAQHSARCAFSPAHRRAAQRHHRRRSQRRLSRSERIFRLARAQEIQAARARFSQPLSRLRHLSRMRWHAAAPGSARRAHRRQIHHRGLRDDRGASAEIFYQPRTRRRTGQNRRQNSRRDPAAPAVS